MFDYVVCNVLQPAGTSNEGFQLCPFGFGFLNIVHIFHLQLFVQILHQFAPFGTQFYLGQAALIEDAYRGTVFHCLGDVVHVNIVAEYCGRVLVGQLYGGASEADIGGIG